MSISHKGFLGSEALNIPEQSKRQYSEYFTISEKLNELGHTVYRDAITKKASQLEHLVPLLLYIRVLNTFAAAIILIERGLSIEAGTLTRSILESTVYLAKSVKDPSWIEHYIGSGYREKEKLVNVFAQKPQDNVDILGITKEELTELKNRWSSMKTPKSKFTLEEIAKSVGLEGIYDIVIRSLSNTCVHSSPQSLQSFLSESPDGELSVTYGIQRNEVEPIFFALLFSLLSSVQNMSQLFAIDMSNAETLGKEISILFQNGTATQNSSGENQ